MWTSYVNVTILRKYSKNCHACANSWYQAISLLSYGLDRRLGTALTDDIAKLTDLHFICPIMYKLPPTTKTVWIKHIAQFTSSCAMLIWGFKDCIGIANPMHAWRLAAQRDSAFVCMRQQSPSPGHPSTPDEPGIGWKVSHVINEWLCITLKSFLGTCSLLFVHAFFIGINYSMLLMLLYNLLPM